MSKPRRPPAIRPDNNIEVEGDKHLLEYYRERVSFG
jgi:hypothetical protein